MKNISIAPPFAKDIEEVVLGTIIQNPIILDEVFNIVGINDVFYDTTNLDTWLIIKEFFNNEKPIDILTIFRKAKDNNRTNVSLFYLNELVNKATLTSHVIEYVNILLDKHIRRQLLIKSDEIRNKAIDESNDIINTISELDGSLNKIQEDSINSTNIKHASEFIYELNEQLTNRMINYNSGITSITGLNYGLSDLNRITNGLQNSDLIVIAARPGMGKTSLMLHIAKSICEQNKKGLIYSLEMSSSQLVQRMVNGISEVNPDNIKSGNINQYEYDKINSAYAYIENLPLYVDDKPSIRVNYIKNTALKKKKKDGLDFIMIDYLQLLNLDYKGNNESTRAEKVGKAANDLKAIAKQLNIPVILLSQLNRGLETRNSKIPNLSDLKESGGIEEAADIVMFIYRPEQYKLDSFEDGSSSYMAGQIIIAKHRNGSIGEVKFSHNIGLTKMYDYIEQSNNIQFRKKEEDIF